MAINLRNKRSAEFNTSSMSDLVFLLLIFFMLTSTLVSTNAVSLNLPQSKQDRRPINDIKVSVAIDEYLQYTIDNQTIEPEQLIPVLTSKLEGGNETRIILSVDFTVPIQNVVSVIDAVNQINAMDPTGNTKHKVILATKPLQ